MRGNARVIAAAQWGYAQTTRWCGTPVGSVAAQKKSGTIADAALATQIPFVGYLVLS
jgi:hypothetical protein